MTWSDPAVWVPLSFLGYLAVAMGAGRWLHHCRETQTVIDPPARNAAERAHLLAELEAEHEILRGRREVDG
jgi:hypothetical protein